MVKTTFKNEVAFRRFAKGLKAYYEIHQKFPTSSSELAEMYQKHIRAAGSEAEMLNDQWGAPHQYLSDGQSYTIISSGPDGAFNTQDDVRIEGNVEGQRTPASP